MRKEFRNLYRHPDDAFGALDKNGTGCVTIEKFMQTIICKRIVDNCKKSGVNNGYKLLM